MIMRTQAGAWARGNIHNRLRSFTSLRMTKTAILQKAFLASAEIFFFDLFEDGGRGPP